MTVRPGARDRILVLTMVMGSIALAALGTEIFLRVAERPMHPNAPRPTPRSTDLPRLSVADLASPNIEGLFRGVAIRTNRDGYRGRDYEQPKPPGVFRILLLGDSFTMGQGVAEESIYATRLERSLNSAQDGTTYEVINLAHAGANLDWSLARLRKTGLAYQPDQLVYGYTANDIAGPYYRKFPGRGRTEQRPPRSSLRLVDRLRSLRDLTFPSYGSYLYELDYNYFENPEAWKFFTSGLDELAQIADERGICAHVLLHTWMKYLNPLHPFRRYYDAVEDAARARGLGVTPTLDRYLGSSTAQLIVGAGDKHPNARAHAVLATALEAGLRSQPERCWQQAAEPLSAPQTHASDRSSVNAP